MDKLWVTIFDVTSKISTPLTLAAFAIAVLALIVWLYGRRPPVAIVLFVIAAVMVLALVPALIGSRAIYHVRVTVVDPKDVPVEDATVWLSVGGEPKKVAGGWQFDVPAATAPPDRMIGVYATIKSAFLAGNQSVELGQNYNPTVIVKLAPDSSARVRGIVVDRTGRGLAGVRVSVAGYDSEAAMTSEGGSFELPAHAADGQQVFLHAQKDGFRGESLWHPAGSVPVRIELFRR